MAEGVTSRGSNSLPQDDRQAALAALRHVWAKVAKLPDTVSEDVTPLTEPDLSPFIAALTGLATCALRECARLAGHQNEAEARQWILDYLGAAMEAVTFPGTCREQPLG